MLRRRRRRGRRPRPRPGDSEDEEATRERTYFDWSYVCPTHEAYRVGLLEIVDDCADANPDVRLDEVGFPRPEYCYCDRCNREFAAWVEDRHDRGGPHPEETTADDRFAWRADVITEFVEEAVDHVPGTTYFTLYPDPYGDHLYERAGLDSRRWSRWSTSSSFRCTTPTIQIY